MLNTHKDVFDQLSKAANTVIDVCITGELAKLACADEIVPAEMESLVDECICKKLASDNAIKVMKVVLFSLQREELEIEYEARAA